MSRASMASDRMLEAQFLDPLYAGDTSDHKFHVENQPDIFYWRNIGTPLFYMNVQAMEWHGRLWWEGNYRWKWADWNTSAMYITANDAIRARADYHRHNRTSQRTRPRDTVQ